MPAVREMLRLPTGVPGLDKVLNGGLPRGSLILVEGPPGSGKTTLALQMLIESARAGEKCLLATSAESPAQLKSIAASHGWSLEGVNITGLSEPADGDDDLPDYTLFPEAEVEIGETLQHLFSEIDRHKPTLLVLDTISSLRIVAPTPAFHRRQLKRIRDFVASHNCTTVILDEASMTEKDLRSQTLSDGLLELRQLDQLYGADRRALRVRKLRGCGYLNGAHDFTIKTGGVSVHPRLVASDYPLREESTEIASGDAAIDTLVGGGLPSGSSTLVVGPAGVGKSTISSMYALAAAKRGEKSAILLFDETIESLLSRSEGLGLDLRAEHEAGRILITHLDPSELSVGQIADLVVRHVQQDNVKLVVIDTLNGYFQSALNEPSVLLHIREVISFLSRRRVAAFVTLTQHGLFGSEIAAPVDFSFLADNVFVLRYFEMDGALHKALSIVKKRSGRHEHTIREITLKPGGIEVSKPLSGFSAVLTGTPIYAREALQRGE